MQLFKGIFAADYSDQEHDDGYDEENVDKPANAVDSHYAQEPENQENDSDCCKHILLTN